MNIKNVIIFIIFICILLLISCKKEKTTFLSSGDINSLSFTQILLMDKWYLPVENACIQFKENNKYNLGHPMGDGYFASGKYKISSNSISISYPNSISETENNYGRNILKWLFENDKEAIFHFDKKYIDFYTKTRLISNNKSMYQYAINSETNKEYILNGILVIKKDETRIYSTENMKLRQSPNIDAPTIDFNYLTNLEWVTNFDYSVNKITKTNILLKGYIVSYDAITKENVTIDGLSAPWYRILISEGDEATTKICWIFGGYVIPDEIQDNKSESFNNKTKDLFLKAAEENGIISKVTSKQ